VCTIQSRLSSLIGPLLGACGLLAATSPALATTFPQYDHVFLIIEENEGFNQIIGNKFAPILNALAANYGLATNYTGVADPSEPNYVAMLGGDTFGISSDDPYWFPGQSVNAENLMSQLEAAGKTWKGYFQGMPYPGYRGFSYPDKSNGIPDSDTQYVSKHNGIVNFTPDMQFAMQAQYDNVSEGFGFLGRFRWEFRPGSEIFIALVTLTLVYWSYNHGVAR